MVNPLSTVKHPSGSFIKLDQEVSLTIQDFAFTGNINLNFFTFKDINGIKVQNATFRINQDVYGYIFNGMND